jgi:hypothetical protein
VYKGESREKMCKVKEEKGKERRDERKESEAAVVK